MKYVITISREYGSGGRFIGRQLAKRLGINFYDNELLAQASEQSGMSKAVFENYDERKDGFFSGIVPTSYGFDMSMGQKVFLAQFDAIRAIAQRESCVIIGRCADYVLRDMPNVVSVFIHASMEKKIERAVKYYGVNQNKAKDTIIKMDKKRRNYYNFYSDRDWGKANTYDLCLTSDIGLDESVDAIKTFAERKLKIKLEEVKDNE